MCVDPSGSARDFFELPYCGSEPGGAEMVSVGKVIVGGVVVGVVVGLVVLGVGIVIGSVVGGVVGVILTLFDGGDDLFGLVKKVCGKY